MAGFNQAVGSQKSAMLRRSATLSRQLWYHSFGSTNPFLECGGREQTLIQLAGGWGSGTSSAPDFLMGCLCVAIAFSDALEIGLFDTWIGNCSRGVEGSGGVSRPQLCARLVVATFSL